MLKWLLTVVYFVVIHFVVLWIGNVLDIETFLASDLMTIIRISGTFIASIILAQITEGRRKENKRHK